MDDIQSVKSRHGHYLGKGFWWIDHALVDGKHCALMVMFGSNIIGDKACYRVGGAVETWFEPDTTDRDAIIGQGKTLIQEKLAGRQITAMDGSPYDWE